MIFVSPPHLSSASVLPCETGNPEIAPFHLNTICCFASEHTNHLNYHLVAVELLFIPKVISCMHQTITTYLEREHSILLSVTRTFYVYQVCNGVGQCGKDGSCSSSSLEWKLMNSISGIFYCLNKCQTLSKTSQMTFFLSGRQRIGAHALCVQHSATAAALSTSFLLNHAPKQPQAECIDYKI